MWGCNGANEMIEKRPLRSLVRGVYDLQHLRIAIGLRIVGNFKAKLGQEPGKKEFTIDAEGRKILKNLRDRYRLLTDGVATFPRIEDFKGDELIGDYAELCLIGHYLSLLRNEEDQFKAVQSILPEFEIYRSFLKDVPGVGRAMAGVMICEIDISRCKYASSLWKYAGLDVAQSWCLDRTEPANMLKLAKTHLPLSFPDGLKAANCTVSENGQSLAVANKGFVAHYVVRSDGRSARTEHQIDREYTDVRGQTKTKKSITYNPFLKAKLAGVLADCMLRAPRGYKEFYYDYKHRMENHRRYGTHNDKKKGIDGRIITSKGRRNNMARRYMVKMFLVDLYRHWRRIEGLPVHGPYSEAKLEIRHSA